MADLGPALIKFSMTVSLAIVTIFALRLPIRKVGGPMIAYGLWVLIPMAVASVFLPAPPTGLGFVHHLDLSRSILHTTAIERSVPGLATSGASSRAAVRIPFLQLWLAGAVVLVVRLVWLEVRLAYTLSRLRPHPELRDVYYMDGGNAGPMVVGLWRPKIILPADFPERYEAEERQLILAHERAHVRGRHLLAGAAAYMFLIVQWFNPLAYVAFALFRDDQELACDAMVVAAYPQKRAAYARAMFKTGLSRVSAPLACCWSRGSTNPTRRRIAMLKAVAPSAPRRWIGSAITIVAVSAGTLVAYAATPNTRDVVSVAATRIQAPGFAAGSVIELRGRSSPMHKPSREGETNKSASDNDFFNSGEEAIQPTVEVNQPISTPLSFRVPEGMSYNDAALAAGLPNRLGYGMDMASLPGQATMIKCDTPETPATVRC